MTQRYKYNTISEFLSDYCLGNKVNPIKDMAPEVRRWASERKYDIPTMLKDSKDQTEIDRLRIEVENLKSQMEEMKRDLDLLMAERNAHLKWLDAIAD